TAGRLDRSGRAIDTDHLARGPDEVRDEHRDIAAPAADIKHPHASCDPRSAQERQDERRVELRLGAQAPQFMSRMPKEVLVLALKRALEVVIVRVCGVHAHPPPPAWSIAIYALTPAACVRRRRPARTR